MFVSPLSSFTLFYCPLLSLFIPLFLSPSLSLTLVFSFHSSTHPLSPSECSYLPSLHSHFFTALFYLYLSLSFYPLLSPSLLYSVFTHLLTLSPHLNVRISPLFIHTFLLPSSISIYPSLSIPFSLPHSCIQFSLIYSPSLPI